MPNTRLVSWGMRMGIGATLALGSKEGGTILQCVGARLAGRIAARLSRSLTPINQPGHRSKARRIVERESGGASAQSRSPWTQQVSCRMGDGTVQYSILLPSKLAARSSGITGLGNANTACSPEGTLGLHSRSRDGHECGCVRLSTVATLPHSLHSCVQVLPKWVAEWLLRLAVEGGPVVIQEHHYR